MIFIRFYSSIPTQGDGAIPGANKNITVNRKEGGQIIGNSGAQLTRPPSRTRIRLKRAQTAHSVFDLQASIKKGQEIRRLQDSQENRSAAAHGSSIVPGSSDTPKYLTSTKDASLAVPCPSSSGVSKTNHYSSTSSELSETTAMDLAASSNKPLTNYHRSTSDNTTEERDEFISNQHSSSTSGDLSISGINRFRIGRRESTISRIEMRQRETMWDLFQSENAFLIDHLMVLKHVSWNVI